MIKRKKFGVSEALKQGLSDTIKIVENNNADFRNTVIPLTRIEPDPDNPRKLVLDADDIKKGLYKDDPYYQIKSTELEGIIELAKSIKDTALLHPIIVHKDGEKYKIIAGERRFLAILFLKRSEIEARVFNEKPTGFKQKLVQWFENNAREDLSLYEKIENIRSLSDAYLSLNSSISKLSVDILSQITGLSKSQAANYLIALNLPSDIYDLIKNAHINSLKKVIEITKIKDLKLREKALDACRNNLTLEFLQGLVEQDKKHKTPLPGIKSNKRGRGATRVNLGFTANRSVIKKMILAHVNLSNNANLNTQVFQDINWEVYEDVTKAFKRFISILEKVEEKQ